MKSKQIASLLVICLSVACVSVTQTEKNCPYTVIRIGALVDPGTTSLYGDAIRLAESQMNSALEKACSDVRFEVMFGDTQANTPPVAVSETLRLLNEEGVMAMVSDTSGDTIQVNRLNYDPMSAAPYQFPVNCYQCSSGAINNPASTHADPITQASLRDSDNRLRRVFYIANYEAAVLDQIIAGQGDRNGDGTLKLSIYADNGHMSLAEAIPPTLINYYSGDVSIEIIVLSNLDNLNAEWAMVTDNINETTGTMDGEPDYIVMAMLPGAVTAAVQVYRDLGYTLPVISNNSFRRNYIAAQLGVTANGLEGSSVAVANLNQSGQLFIDAFTEANGIGPEQTCSGAYDAMMSMFLASLVAADNVGAANVTPADIQAGLDRINEADGKTVRPSVMSLEEAVHSIAKGKSINYDGAYDPLEWDAEGNMYPALVHWVVRNEQFVELESYMCDPSNPLCPVIP